MLAFREVNKEQHVGGEAEAVAKLLDEDTQVNDEQRVILEVAQVDEGQTCERHAPSHGVQPFLQTALGCHDAANDATERQTNDAHGAINKAHLLGCETQTAFLQRVEEERIDELHELCLGQTVEQHEENGH